MKRAFNDPRLMDAPVLTERDRKLATEPFRDYKRVNDRISLNGLFTVGELRAMANWLDEKIKEGK